ncbi:hypothetical protein, partial [Marinospirillum sp.]|uniref:hypothetical protein n=1 Tax=Marinospirillum sp. TaxID=2183934 RepID=UPI003A855CAB
LPTPVAGLDPTLAVSTASADWPFARTTGSAPGLSLTARDPSRQRRRHAFMGADTEFGGYAL